MKNAIIIKRIRTDNRVRKTYRLEPDLPENNLHKLLEIFEENQNLQKEYLEISIYNVFGADTYFKKRYDIYPHDFEYMRWHDPIAIYLDKFNSLEYLAAAA